MTIVDDNVESYHHNVQSADPSRSAQEEGTADPTSPPSLPPLPIERSGKTARNNLVGDDGDIDNTNDNCSNDDDDDSTRSIEHGAACVKIGDDDYDNDSKCRDSRTRP